MNRFFVIIMISFVISLAGSCRMGPNTYNVPGECKELYLTAKEYKMTGELDSSLIYYNKLNECSPDNAWMLHERGLIYSDLKKYDHAIQDMNRSIELVGDVEDKTIMHLNRALVWLDSGDTASACRDFAAAGQFGKGYIDDYCAN